MAERYASESEGTNASEEYLAKLCRKSFLRLWSYPNLYRGVNRELIDIVIIFNDNVIIFSDKNIEFNLSKPLHVAWSRWYREAITESKTQIYRAEDWIKRYPDKIYLDVMCAHPLQMPLPAPEKMKIHRIAVARGAASACLNHPTYGGEGLIICPEAAAPNYKHGDELNDNVFFVGDVDIGRGYVHVFDEKSLDIILNELDTITDFINYLSAKEDLVRNGKRNWAGREEDLLAFYTVNKYLGPPKAFRDLSVQKRSFLGPNWWSQIKNLAQYQTKKIDDRVSYLWDNLIETLTENAYDGKTISSRAGFLSLETLLRRIASHSRYERRDLAKAFLGCAEHANINVQTNTRRFLSGKVMYVFLCGNRRIDESEEGYRARRKEHLARKIIVVGFENQKCNEVVGIATGFGGDFGVSFDVAMLDNTNWSLDAVEEAKRIRTEFGTVKETIKTIFTSEYPLLPGAVAREAGRNEPCPCGSGKKYKKCCLPSKQLFQ